MNPFPLLYLVGSSPSAEQLLFVLNALGITPVAGVITAKAQLLSFAARFSEHMILDDDTQDHLIERYLQTAKDLNAPLAIIVESSEPLTAVYADSSQVVICS